MNREIKFRGRSEYGAFVYGDLIQYENGDAAIFEKKLTKYGCEATEICKRTKVNAKTVSQFTGLYDKNGKEIYEGDILGTNESVIGWVKGGVRGYCYDVVYINHLAVESDWPLYGTVKYDYPGKIKVIGNIYDNKELLEETK